jgi:ketosteroid isomerase-like protein
MSTLPDPWQMMNLTSQFYAHLDARDYPSVMDCFTEGGEWFRRGSSVKGKNAIEDALAHRPADFHTAHVVSNVRVHQTSDTAGYVLFYLTGHPHHGEIPVGQYVALPLAHMLSEVRDTLHKVGDRWYIAEKRPIRILFQRDAKLP